MIWRMFTTGSWNPQVPSLLNQPTEPSSLVPLHLNLGSVCGNLRLPENAKLLFG